MNSAYGKAQASAVLAVDHGGYRRIVADKQFRKHFPAFGAVVFYVLDVELSVPARIFA